MAIQVTVDQMKAFEEIKSNSFKYIPKIRAYIHMEEDGVKLRYNASGSFLLSFEDIKSLSSLNESDRIDAVRKLVKKHFWTVTLRYIEYVVKNGITFPEPAISL